MLYSRELHAAVGAGEPGAEEAAADAAATPRHGDDERRGRRLLLPNQGHQNRRKSSRRRAASVRAAPYCLTYAPFYMYNAGVFYCIWQHNFAISTMT